MGGISGISGLNSSCLEYGANNINQDPLFVDSDSQDFTLQSNSPCIDSGSADLDGDGIDDILGYYGTAPDMGAFEWIGAQLGDINQDGSLDVLDIILVVNIILNNTEYDEIADMNQDNSINVLDIILIVNIILE